jgi:hypothetical protein
VPVSSAIPDRVSDDTPDFESHTDQKDSTGNLKPSFPLEILQSSTLDDVHHVQDHGILVEACLDDLHERELEVSMKSDACTGPRCLLLILREAARPLHCTSLL